MSWDLNIAKACPWLSESFCAGVNGHLQSITSTDARNQKFMEIVWHVQKIELGDMSGRDFARMSNAEMMSMTGENVLAEQKIESYNALANKEFIIEGGPTLTCKKCNGAVRWEVRQTRRADEGSTIFVFCEPCDVRWKL